MLPAPCAAAKRRSSKFVGTLLYFYAHGNCSTLLMMSLNSLERTFLFKNVMKIQLILVCLTQIVVSPLVALMQDQVRYLRGRKVDVSGEGRQGEGREAFFKCLSDTFLFKY
jgi:hypothetical protein